MKKQIIILSLVILFSLSVVLAQTIINTVPKIQYQEWKVISNNEPYEVYIADKYNKTTDIWVLSQTEIKKEEFNLLSNRWDTTQTGDVRNIPATKNLYNSPTASTSTPLPSSEKAFDNIDERGKITREIKFGYKLTTDGKSTYYKFGEHSIVINYINQTGGSAKYGTTVCLDPDQSNSNPYQFNDINYNATERENVSSDDGDTVRTTFKSYYGSGTNCCGLAENTLATSCSGYVISDCPYYLIYSSSFGLWTKCMWVPMPGICVPALPCRNYIGEVYYFNVTTNPFTNITFTTKLRTSVSVTPQTTTFYLQIFNPLGSGGNYWDGLTSGSTSRYSNLTAGIIDSKYVSNGIIGVLVTSDVVGGVDYSLDTFYVEAKTYKCWEKSGNILFIPINCIIKGTKNLNLWNWL